MQTATGNILVTYGILCVTCMTWAGIEAARLTLRMNGSFPACLVASLVYSTANYNVHTVFRDGTLGRILILPLVPWLVRTLLDCVEKPAQRHVAVATGILSGMILAHVLQAYQSCLLLIPFFLVLCVQRRDFRAVLALAEVVIVAIAIVSFWVLPGVTQLEMPGVPWSPPEIVSQTSFGLTSLLRLDSPFAATIIFPTAVVGFFVALRRPEVKSYSIALLASAAIGGSLLMGTSNPLFFLLPARDTIRPLRFVNCILVFASVLVGYAFSGLSERLSLRHLPGKDATALALILVFMALCSVVNEGPSLGAPDRYMDIADLVAAVPADEPGFGSGRLATELPTRGGESAYLPVRRGLNLVAGWSIEGTPHQYTFYDHNIAYDAGNFGYVIRNWDLWNVRYLILDEQHHRSMVDYLKQKGWTQVAHREGMALLTSAYESRYVMRAETTAIAIGRSSSRIAFLVPWVVQGREPDPLKYDDDYLSMFSTIFLYDLPELNIDSLEARIIDWVQQGKRVVIDLSMSGIGSVFGVRCVDKPLKDAVTIERIGSDGLPIDSVSLEVTDGLGATYQGLDSVLARFAGSGEAIAGIRELQHGSVCFLGGHIPRLVNPDMSSEAAAFLGWFVTPDGRSDDGSFSCGGVTRIKGGVEFDYHAERQTNALVSISYSPRWHVMVDGDVLVRIYNHENLILLRLPAGSHHVALRYGLTDVAVSGVVISVLSMAFFAFRHVSVRKSRKGGVYCWDTSQS